MTAEQYYELMNELNFSDSSVGQSSLTLNDLEAICDILAEFNYTPVGQYETKNSKGFKFMGSIGEVFCIHEENDLLKVYKLIEL